MTKFKERSLMKQYLQLKPTKWGFKRLFRYADNIGYLYESGKKKDVEVNLKEAQICS